MAMKLARRIERTISLRYYYKSKTWRVETHRPCGRNWAWHNYTPTPASLARVKRLVGYHKGYWNECGYGYDGVAYSGTWMTI